VRLLNKDKTLHRTPSCSPNSLIFPIILSLPFFVRDMISSSERTHIASVLSCDINKNMLLFPQKPVLTVSQIERVSNILDNAGQVLLGVMVISPLIGGFDKLDIGVVVLGLIGVLFCWMISIRLAKYKDI